MEERLAAIDLVFLPGFTSKNEVTDVSGRGVGLDVVKTRLQQIGGEVTVTSAVGEGTTFELKVPLSLTVAPVLCTKIAAKLVRTFTDRHGLKDLCKELLGVDLSKQQQTSDWGAPDLSPDQLAYAASDVLHLHALWAKLEGLLKREGRLDLAEACFRFLPARGKLDLLGYEDPDILSH